VNIAPTSVASCQEGHFKGLGFVDSRITAFVPLALHSHLLCARRPGGLCPDNKVQVGLGRPGHGKFLKTGWLEHTTTSVQLWATAQQGESIVFGPSPAGD